MGLVSNHHQGPILGTLTESNRTEGRENRYGPSGSNTENQILQTLHWQPTGEAIIVLKLSKGLLFSSSTELPPLLFTILLMANKPVQIADSRSRVIVIS